MRFLIIAIACGSITLSCQKEEKRHRCYDASIVHDGNCSTDCPGVKGCDGKTYCNECEAARHGIKPAK